MDGSPYCVDCHGLKLRAFIVTPPGTNAPGNLFLILRQIENWASLECSCLRDAQGLYTYCQEETVVQVLKQDLENDDHKVKPSGRYILPHIATATATNGRRVVLGEI